MTDRDLLEFAAKAAGIKGEYDAKWGGILIPVQVHEPGDGLEFWNSLDDDGDCFRLAMALQLEYVIDRVPGTQTMKSHGEVVRVRVWARGWHKVEVGPSIDPDLPSATRRAITLAAAEIGKEM